MDYRNRRHALIYLIATAIGIYLLAVGLPNLEFQPGLPIPGAVTEISQPNVVEPAATERTLENPAVLQIALLIGVGLVLVLAVVYLTRKISGKRALQFLVGIFILIAVTFLLSGLNPAQSSAEIGNVEVESKFNQTLYNIAPIGNPPVNLTWIVIGGLILITSLLAAWLLYQALHNRRRENVLAKEASAAIQAIEEGQDLHDVIIRCYQNMINFIREERGIERKEFVTPREFEALLAANGVPAEPTRQITRLFEKVRYGHKAPNDQDKQIAIECLTAIRDTVFTPGEGTK